MRTGIGELYGTVDFDLVGRGMYELMAELYPICRSITGRGVRETLHRLRRHVQVALREVPSGTRVLDWVVPREWNIHDAYVVDPSGRKIVDFTRCNLHVVSYSTPLRKKVRLAELKQQQQRALELEAQRNLAERNLDAARKEAKRIRRRIEAGVCVDCKRTFSSLAAHMRTQHGKKTKKGHEAQKPRI